MKTERTPSDYQALYVLWDSFLTKGPLADLAAMTLVRYASVGDPNAFRAWGGGWWTCWRTPPSRWPTRCVYE